MSKDYLIWSNEHRAWWRAKRSGYTVHLSAAGRYSREEAITICAGARHGWREGEVPPEVPVAEVDALETANTTERLAEDAARNVEALRKTAYTGSDAS